VGAALAIAEGTSGVGSGGGADKASIAAPEALESGVYGRAGGAGAKATAWRGLGRSRRTSGKGRVSAHRVEKDVTEQGESMRWGPQREGLGKSATEQRALTSGGRRGRICQRTEKSDLMRGTHKMGTVGQGRACRMLRCGDTGNDRG